MPEPIEEFRRLYALWDRQCRWLNLNPTDPRWAERFETVMGHYREWGWLGDALKAQGVHIWEGL